jgi:hypothetical protein
LESGFKVDIADGLREAYDTAQSDESRHKKTNLAWTKAATTIAGFGFFATAALGYIYFGQLKSMQDSVNIARDPKPVEPAWGRVTAPRGGAGIRHPRRSIRRKNRV